MMRDDSAIGVAIKTNITLVVRGIAKEYAQSGAGGKFVGSSGREIGIALASEDAKMIIGWVNTE
jgi:hypothetical protein